MPKVDVCLSPELISLYDLKGKIVVIVDILRATTCMVAGLGNGVQAITPFASVEECVAMREKGYIIAGERGGQKVEGFDMGNSPFSYMENSLKGKKVAVTTTNGTRAIHLSQDADEIIIGAFLNLSSVAEYLLRKKNDVLIFCAGWRGQVNLEDTTFAGALIERLGSEYVKENDSVRVAQSVYAEAKNDLYGYLSTASHAERLKKHDIQKDIQYCMTLDEFEVVPVITGGEIIIN